MMIENQLKKRIEIDIKKEFDDMQEKAYKELWKDNSDKKCIIETPLKDKIIVMDGEISFNSGKSFINRSEEGLIKDNFNIYKKKIVDYVYDCTMDENDSVQRKSRNNITDSMDDLKSELFDLLRNLDDEDRADLTNKMGLVFELKSIDEQIELVKELGDKKKLLSLLEEKHRLIKKLNTF